VFPKLCREVGAPIIRAQDSGIVTAEILSDAKTRWESRFVITGAERHRKWFDTPDSEHIREITGFHICSRCKYYNPEQYAGDIGCIGLLICCEAPRDVPLELDDDELKKEYGRAAEVLRKWGLINETIFCLEYSKVLLSELESRGLVSGQVQRPDALRKTLFDE
jgi:hypothetical protein